MSARLAGKVALISGGARGQGEAEARRFVAEGARVLLADVRDDEGEVVAKELGDAAFYQHLDVTEAEQWDAAVAAATDRFGALHILINNAGVGAVGLLDTLDLEEHRRIIDINLHGVYLGMRAAKAPLVATGNGAIVNISSIDGLVGVLGMTSYAGSKFAVTGMTRSAALELGPLGVRVNSIHPGVIASPMDDLAISFRSPAIVSLADCSKGSDMFSPKLFSRPAPRCPASMIPPPAPVITIYPSSASLRPNSTPA